MPARFQSKVAPPILMVAMRHNVQAIAQCCESAAAAGVQPGMTLAHARALIQRLDCQVEPFDLQRDLRALKRLAAWAARRYSPWVAPDPPDGLLMDITGCQRLFGGEARLLRCIVRDIERLGFGVRAVCASTFGSAWAAARFMPRTLSIVPPQSERAALAPLPVAALRLDEETIEALQEVDIELIGHLLALPRDQLAARYGGDLLMRLDQAMGEALETIDPVRPQLPPGVERVFDGPVKQLEAIELTVRELLESLCATLLRSECGVRRLDLEFTRIDAHPLGEMVMLSRPSRSAAHLWSVLRPRIEKLNLGYGIERIALTALRLGKLPHEQAECDLAPYDARGLQSPGFGVRKIQDTTIDRAAGELVDTLSARLDPHRVLRIQPLESHVPELSFRFRAAMDNPPHVRGVEDAAIAAAERPTLLLAQPESIEVELIDERPARLHGRGGECAIAACRGPERIAMPWWNLAAHPLQLARRDYFTVRDQCGRTLWLYRESQSGRWFMHGVWA